MSLALNQHVEPMNVNDKEIFLAIRKHPEEEFRKLMAAYMQPVYWHIRRMVSVHADAEDATQETFVRIYRSIGQSYQTFGGVDLYPSVEEKAAMLLYLVTKNHSFSAGNKRIAASALVATI